MSFLLSRDTKVIVRDVAGLEEASEFGIISGFTVDTQTSFRSSRSATDTLNSEGSRLPGKTYLDERSPTKFTFETYIDWEVDTIVKNPHDLLWKSLVGSSLATSATSTDYNINFSESNVASLLPLNIWFTLGTGGVIRLFDCSIDTAEIDIDINKISTIKWSGTALRYSYSGVVALPDRTIYEKNTCLINKYTSIDLALSDTNVIYPIIRGNIKFNNNNSYYVRNKLGSTKTPAGHIPGVLEISGNLKAYLKAVSFSQYNSGTAISLQSLYNNNLEDIPIDLLISIGNSTEKTPRVVLDFFRDSSYNNKVLFKLPKFGFDDVNTVDIEFINIADGGYPTMQYII